VFATADRVIAPNYAHLGEKYKNDLSAQLNGCMMKQVFGRAQNGGGETGTLGLQAK